MKNIYKILFALALTCSACDYLDLLPDNIATLDDAFINAYAAEEYLYTCYSYLPNYQNPNANPTYLASDECWSEVSANSMPGYGVTLSSGGQNVSDVLYNYWAGGNGGNALYQGIRDCNTFLEKIEEVPDLEAAEMRQWKAEVEVLKAYYHFYLVRMYGAVSIVDENLAINSGPDEVAVKRNSIDECFDYITTKIDEQYEYLPLYIEEPGSYMGRLTQPIALAIKARALITAASPLFNGNADYANFEDGDGNRILYSEYDLEKWNTAAQACKQAIDAAELAGHTLDVSYATGESVAAEVQLQMNLRERIVGRYDPTVIWGARAMSGTPGKNFMARLNEDYQYAIKATIGPTIKMAETFYSKNGVPISEDNSYDYTGRYEMKEGDFFSASYIEPGENTAALNFDREPRFYAFMGFDRGAWYLQDNGLLSTPTYVHAKSATATNGEYGSFYGGDFSYTGYYPKKLVHYKSYSSGQGSVSWWNFPFPVIRLSDLYLYYAEALNEYNSSPVPEVYEYVDKVRTAAGLDGVKNSWTTHSNNPTKPNTKAGMRSIIIQERAIELAFEGARYWDVKRWKLANQEFDGVVKGWSASATTEEEYYKLVNLDQMEHNLKDYLWPIPEYQLSVNPNLVQNPGW